jgi:glucose 1-dehydrogenase
MNPSRRLLKGQKALITGASTGIGKGIALALAEAGADVAINYYSQDGQAEELVKSLKKLGVEAFHFQADISQEDQVQALFEATLKNFGSLDIFVNNAGVQADSPLEHMTTAQWNKVIGTNLTGAFFCAREAVRAFKQRSLPKHTRALGNIVFISSVHDRIAWANHANYAASKGGLKLLMESLTQEVAPEGIRVNSVSPGAIRTSINRPAWETPEALSSLLKLIPYGRIGEVEDVGRVLAWLVSDEAEYINGTTLYVDGAMTLYPGFISGG